MAPTFLTRALLAVCTLAASVYSHAVDTAPAASGAQPKAVIATPDDPSGAGKLLFESQFKDLNWKLQPIAQWKGKPMVIYFWATWCKPCVKEVPELIKLYDEYRGKDVVVLGIAVDNADKVQAFMKERGVTYPVLVGGNEAIDLSKKLGNKVGGLPFTVIVDKKGHVVKTYLGEVTKPNLEEILKPILS